MTTYSSKITVCVSIIIINIAVTTYKVVAVFLFNLSIIKKCKYLANMVSYNSVVSYEYVIEIRGIHYDRVY